LSNPRLTFSGVNNEVRNDENIMLDKNKTMNSTLNLFTSPTYCSQSLASRCNRADWPGRLGQILDDQRRELWHDLIMAKYSAAQTKAALRFLPEWTKKGSSITRVFQFRDFSTAIEFVNAVARIAEKVSHHPDIDIRWNKVTLTLTTHDEGGLTEKDFDLAMKADQL
jgi:4a-hydroxytetrahydrobiopterin dehydratase